MNTREMKSEIARLEAAGEDSALPKNTASRLRGLKKALTARLQKSEHVQDFRELAVGKETSHGVIARCPVCGDLGARRQPKWANGATIFAHSLEAVPTLVDIVRCGHNGQFTDAGVHGRFRLKDDFHMVAADGTLVMSAESKKITREPVAKSVAKRTDAQNDPLAGSRRAAALKAWETIRARRALAQAA